VGGWWTGSLRAIAGEPGSTVPPVNSLLRLDLGAKRAALIFSLLAYRQSRGRILGRRVHKTNLPQVRTKKITAHGRMSGSVSEPRQPWVPRERMAQLAVLDVLD